MGREDKAAWKSNYFTKLVVSNLFDFLVTFDEDNGMGWSDGRVENAA
jgi:hypothetical protein